MGVRGRPLPAGEAKRKLVHAGMGLFALALPFLTWQQAALCAVAAFLFNWLILPRLLGHRLTSARADVSDRGVLLYPIVVLALIVLFHRDMALAAFGWGVLAFGDSAAGVVGQKWGRRALPWNVRKSWEGFAAFVVAGGCGGTLLGLWFYAIRHGLHFPHGRAAMAWLVWLVVPVLFAALLESLPHGLDDNVLPALCVPLLDHLAASGGVSGYHAAFALPLLVNSACAAIALATRALRPGGVAVAWVLGVLTWAAAGWRGFSLLLAFLLLGLGVTFLGFRRKAARGTAENHAGRRGGAEVFGKGGVLLVLCWQGVLAGMLDGRLAGWVVVAVLAAATADTWATELGSLWGRRAFTLWPLREVPAGTSGAVSVAGLVASLAGAALISALGALLGMLAPRTLILAVACTLAAFVATVVESLLPCLGEASHAGKNLVVTLLAPLLIFAVLEVLR